MGGMAGKLAMTLSMGLDFIGMGAFAGGGGGPLLDSGIATATNGYSLRKLRAAYAGSAIKVRRSSDDTTQDIGFVGSDLDTASLATFVGANSGYIDTWYDQVGSANLVQATTANQPRIVNAGSLDTKNTKPTLIFDGTNDTVSVNPTGLVSATQFTALAVASVTGGSRILSIAQPTAGDYGAPDAAVPLYKNGTSIDAIRNSVNSVGGTFTSGQLFTAFTIYDATNQTVVFDGTTGTPVAFAATALRATDLRLAVGSNGASLAETVAGSVSEVILWASALSAGDKTALIADTRTYWGTP